MELHRRQGSSAIQISWTATPSGTHTVAISSATTAHPRLARPGNSPPVSILAGWSFPRLHSRHRCASGARFGSVRWARSSRYWVH